MLPTGRTSAVAFLLVAQVLSPATTAQARDAGPPPDSRPRGDARPRDAGPAADGWAAAQVRTLEAELAGLRADLAQLRGLKPSDVSPSKPLSQLADVDLASPAAATGHLASLKAGRTKLVDSGIEAGARLALVEPALVKALQRHTRKKERRRQRPRRPVPAVEEKQARQAAEQLRLLRLERDVGFALKDLAASVLAGVTILFDRPFQVGDRVTFGRHYGEISAIGLRSVRLVTLDDSLVTIPNNKFLTEVVVSGNAGALDMQIVVDFFIASDADVERARRIVTEAVRTSRFVYLEKPVVVLVNEVIHESYVATRLRAKAYVLDVKEEKAYETDVSLRVKQAFAAAGIRSPAVVLRWDGDGVAPRGKPATTGESR